MFWVTVRQVFDHVNGLHWVQVLCGRLTWSHRPCSHLIYCLVDIRLVTYPEEQESMSLVEVRAGSAVLTHLGSRWGKDGRADHLVQFEFKLGHERSFAEPVGFFVDFWRR